MFPLIKNLPLALELLKLIPVDKLQEKIQERKGNKVAMDLMKNQIGLHMKSDSLTAVLAKELLHERIDVKETLITPPTVLPENIEKNGLTTSQMMFLEAMKDYGIRELPGSEHNPKILKYSKEIGIPVAEDETSWCSIAMCAIANRLKLIHPGSAAARSWLTMGEDVTDKPVLGDIIVLWREKPESWKGHVGLYVNYSEDKKKVHIFGGNQSNAFSIAPYDASRILSIRRLKKHITNTQNP